MKAAAAAAEVLATLLLGLMAGFFFAFAADVAPAMRQLDAQGYIATQQAINHAVRNALFGGVYFGSALLPWLAAAAWWAAGNRARALAWAGLALVYTAGVFVLTRQVNVPINDAVALWNPLAPPADWAAARDAWNGANLVRSAVAAACFAAAVGLRTWFPDNGRASRRYAA
jgi:uncharacterized membrane protein